MNVDVQEILDGVSDDDPRSRLEPYREVILRWRRPGKTFKSYKRIGEIMATKCAIKVSGEAVRKFVIRRSRPRKPEKETEPQRATEALGQVAAPVMLKPWLTPEEMAAMREAARAANHQPLVPDKPKPRFVYDPSKPITNKNL